ncbi:Isoleucine--tRNA ligase [Planctomycetes bacterium Pan216]|uniref:Isoleucine--tRNA ligase n=1 Tax=Kolteria novifilia TaxID=2527975 RepID=A0A518B4A5_9BACT|nr:Isoleucine--tRNA ligase [Planctomycetes bacterium Pan216]
MFEEISPRIDFPKAERETLEFWQERDIYAKTLANRADAETFVFFEGPPTANGMPHPGHCLTRVIKDVFPRYFTMRGYRCERKAGWDTHGLPVEVEVGKELGIHSKQEIEDYGIEPFIHRCIQSVFRYTREWEELTKRIGFWVNLDDAYVTYHQSYVESVWWALKTLFDRGLLYQGHKVVWWWAQGGTALSSGEVAEGYRDTDDPSIYVRFRLKQPSKLKGLDDGVATSMLAWTTTPWTLSSNIALAVKDDLDYVVLEFDKEGERERFVLAEALIEKTFAGLKLDLEKDLREVACFKGSDLVGLSYEPIFRYMEPTEGRQWEVDTADFVTTEQGTGVVHVAPAFGEDDYRFGREKGFGFLQMVKPDGKFRPEATEVAGKFCKEADKEIIQLLKDSGTLLKRDVYRHSYPFCPRAEQDPLIQYARHSWFIKTTEFKDRFLENNQQINWMPEHIKEGRFGDFLRNNVDWAISRERFWGTPLPVWQCEKTGQQEVIGSYDELLAKPDVQGTEVWEAAKKADPELSDDLRVHKPYIDEITYQSPHDPDARMRRVPEVIDCWFDSGCMPFAQWGYPHQNKEKFQEQYPANFISEAIDQTRGWFYSLLAIGTMLQDQMGENPPSYPLPFRNCIVLGHMMGEDGKKMSKRLKNYSEPTAVFDKYGADALRWFFLCGQAPWSSIRFQESGIQESQREFLIRLQNIVSFFTIYANIDQFDPKVTPFLAVEKRALLDRWIVGELHQAIAFVSERMDNLDNFGAAGRISAFVDALSNWYLRRSRERFWTSGFDDDKRAAYWTLYECLVTLAQLTAPFVPFMAERIYRSLVAKVDSAATESVHLCDWPQADSDLVDQDLAHEMDLVREVVSVGRSARTEAKLKVRQPLAAVEVLLADVRHAEALTGHEELIETELNVKRVEFTTKAEDYVEFSLKANPKRLGPRFGKKMGAISKALGSVDAASVRRQLIDEGAYSLEVNGEAIELTGEDVFINLSARPGYAAAEGRRAVVVLTTEVTPELKQEGVAREIVHAIQGMRRELDLAFTDRIEVGVETSGVVASATEAHTDYIKSETLADSVKLTALDSSSLAQAIDIEGTQVRIGVTKA